MRIIYLFIGRIESNIYHEFSSHKNTIVLCTYIVNAYAFRIHSTRRLYKK